MGKKTGLGSIWCSPVQQHYMTNYSIKNYVILIFITGLCIRLHSTVLYICSMFFFHIVFPIVSVYFFTSKIEHIINLPFLLKHAVQQKDVSVWRTPQTIWKTPPYFVPEEEMRGFPTTFLSFKWASSNRSLIWKLPSLSFIANPFQAQWKAEMLLWVYSDFLLFKLSPSVISVL